MISKPISGAREEGVGGFIKGVGKGMVGLFMRPASGVVDFASGTVDVVRRLVEILPFPFLNYIKILLNLFLQSGYLFRRNSSLSITALH